jgi:hypothetical protein
VCGDPLLAGVKAVGDELAETDIEWLGHAAEGPYAPLAAPATVIPLTDRLAGERTAGTPYRAPAEEEAGQLAFDLAA